MLSVRSFDLFLSRGVFDQVALRTVLRASPLCHHYQMLSFSPSSKERIGVRQVGDKGVNKAQEEVAHEG